MDVDIVKEKDNKSDMNRVPFFEVNLLSDICILCPVFLLHAYLLITREASRQASTNYTSIIRFLFYRE